MSMIQTWQGRRRGLGKGDEPWYSPTSLSDLDTPRAPEEPMTYDAP